MWKSSERGESIKLVMYYSLLFQLVRLERAVFLFIAIYMVVFVR